MAAADLEYQLETENQRIERWRLEELIRAGYSVPTAELLAAANEVDLHLATELLQRGCKPELAVRILL
jgi:hypothetical protein